MNTQASHIPSITEINQAVELAKKERSEYMAELISALPAKLSAIFRSSAQSAAGKVSPSH